MHSHALFVAAALIMTVASGCSKKEDPAAGGAQPANTLNIGVSQGGGAMAAPESDVTRYPDEGPEIGTVLLKTASIARRSADQSSEILSRLGPGTAVNKKARKGPYYLVEFPFAPGQMRLGWIEQNDVNAPAPVATTTTTNTAPIVVRPTATASATTTAPGGRPPIVIRRP